MHTEDDLDDIKDERKSNKHQNKYDDIDDTLYFDDEPSNNKNNKNKIDFNKIIDKIKEFFSKLFSNKFNITLTVF